ncbi:MAG TPA: hypothetical protein VKT82_32955 [Ktedonobacterales bacterium]|nr:hypothetical protein [Ktedonobacterales bacterium]
MPVILRFSGYGVCIVGLLLALLGLFPSSAFADGGAPQLAYVAGAANGIGVIDIAQQRVAGSIAVAGNPHAVLLSPDGSTLYVTQPTLGRVVVITAKTGKTMCAANVPGQPSLLAFSLNTPVVYTAGQGDTSVRALNPTTCAIERAFDTHEPIYGMAVTASTAVDATPSTPNQLWITGPNAITIFDASGALLGAVPVAAGPQYICWPGGFTAYVTTRQGTVVAVDLGSRKVIRTLLSGGPFGTMDYDATTGEVYVPDEMRDQLDVLIPVTASMTTPPREPVRVFHLNGSPQSIAITSDGTLGFVALGNGQVVMLDVPGRKVIASFGVGGTPHFIITGTYPPKTNTAFPTPPAGPSSSSAISPSRLLLLLAVALAGLVLLGALWFVWRQPRKRSAS